MKKSRPVFLWLEARWHFMVSFTRFLFGRWFVFRDRPDWFVAMLADEWRSGCWGVDDQDLIDYAEQANDEWRLRRRRRLRA